MSASRDPSDRPGEADPYSYFCARGVTREALRAWLEDEVRRTVKSYRAEGEPIAELYRLLGLDWMVALMALLGGTTVYVPKSVELARAKWPELPAELCGLLVEHRQGSSIDVPTPFRVFTACRRDLIVKRAVSGLSNSAIAREFGVSARHVRGVITDARRAGVAIGAGRGRDNPAYLCELRRRDQQILQRLEAGETQNEVAAAFGISEGVVRNALNRARRQAEATPC